VAIAIEQAAFKTFHQPPEVKTLVQYLHWHFSGATSHCVYEAGQQQEDPPQLLTTANHGTTSYTDHSCLVTAGYTHDLVWYDVRSYFSVSGVYLYRFTATPSSSKESIRFSFPLLGKSPTLFSPTRTT
jgi:hypothetical protein